MNPQQFQLPLNLNILPSMRTPRLTKAFIQERDKLLKDGVEVLSPIEDERFSALQGPHPSKEFCQRFLDRLERGHELAEREYGGRDAEDYCAWGYALFGDSDLDAEDETRQLCLFDWIEYYGLE